MAHPCQRFIDARDAAEQAFNRLTAADAYAVARVQAINAQLLAMPALFPRERDWATNYVPQMLAQPDDVIMPPTKSVYDDLVNPNQPAYSSAAAKNRIRQICSWLEKHRELRLRILKLDAAARAARDALYDCLQEYDTVAPAPPAPEPVPQNDSGYDDLTTSSTATPGGGSHLCGAPTRGHGHVGKPCAKKVRAGGRCHYHPSGGSESAEPTAIA